MYEVLHYHPQTGSEVTSVTLQEVQAIMNNLEADFYFNEVTREMRFRKGDTWHQHSGNIPQFGKKTASTLALLLKNPGEYLQPQKFYFLGEEGELPYNETVSARVRVLRKLLRDTGMDDPSNFIISARSPFMIRWNPEKSFYLVNRMPVSIRNSSVIQTPS